MNYYCDNDDENYHLNTLFIPHFSGCHHTWGIGGTLPDPSSQALLPSVIENANVPLQTGKGVSSAPLIEKVSSMNRTNADFNLILENIMIK